jgi:hypothetical protein
MARVSEAVWVLAQSMQSSLRFIHVFMVAVRANPGKQFAE